MAGEAIIPHAVVTVDGVARPASKVRVTRELATDMPAQVASGGGMVAATATVEWANDRDGIQDSRVDILKPNSRVTVDAGVAGATGALFRRFTGKLDVSSGTASDGGSSSSLVDDTSRLDRVVTTPCHFSMEPSGAGISLVGLGTPWLAYEVARQCGMSAYHYNTSTLVWASLAGSTLPAWGYTPGYSNSASWDPVVTPTGVGINVSEGRSIEWAHDPIGADGGQSVEASIWADPGTPGRIALRVAGWTAPTGQRGPRLVIGDGQVYVTWQENSTVTNISPGIAASGWQPVAMHVTWGSIGWDISVRVGETVHGPWRVSDPTAYNFAATAKWATLLFLNPGEATKTVAGLVVDRLTTTVAGWREHRHVMAFRYDAHLTQLLTWLVLPPQDAVQGLSLLKQMSEAELAGLWVDEDGVLRYRTRIPLREAPVTKTVTSDGSLLDYSWAYSLDAVRKRVVVKWRRPVYTIRATPTLAVWDSGDQSWKSNDTTWSQFVEPGADEDWLDVDDTFTRGNDRQRNTSSWWSLQVKDDATNNTIRDAVTADFTLKVSLLGGAKVRTLLELDATSAVGSSNYLAGKLTLNARGKATWTDETTIVTSPSAPSDAPDLVHDVGWMMQSTGQPENLANYLAALTAAPLVEVDNVSIVPDPSIRLGDKIRVQDSHVKGWQVEGVVSRIDEEWADGSASMTLGVRVTSFKPDFAATLAQFDRRWAGLRLSDLDAAWSGKTLGQLDAAPLT